MLHQASRVKAFAGFAIEYFPDRTETALERMESAGRVLRNEKGRWAIVLTKTNGHAATGGNGNSLDAPQRAAEVFTGPSGLEEVFPNIAARGI
jgi:hypothetical protein